MEPFNDPDPPIGNAENAEESVEVIAAPSQFDVLLGRGRGNQQHAGNKRLQEMIDLHKNSYYEAVSRNGKLHIARLVVAAVNEKGRFLRYDNERRGWVEVSRTVARQKVCQALQYHKRRGGLSTGTARSSSEHAPSEPPGRSSSVARLPLPDSDPDDSQSFAHEPADPGSAIDACAETTVVAGMGAPSSTVTGLDDLVPFPINESKQGEPVETDMDYMSVIRALSEGAHFSRHRDQDEDEKPAPS